jgi:hypothetical protein
MRNEHKRLVRIANLIRGHVVAQPARQLAALATDERRLGDSLQRYQSLCRQAGKAASRHWYGAARQMANAAENALEDLRYEMNARPRQQHEESLAIASLSDIVRDLDQLETEFHEWRYDEATHDLSVQTEDIELEGVELGTFDIKLHLPSLARPDPTTSYSIIAQDPNPPNARSDVTHPHVSDERLCPGDATGSIRSALEAGRICDFFLLVRSVLQTYNSHSAYVPLASWNGSPCHDCGYTMNDDDGFYCEFCSENFCDSCSSYCRHCETAGCLGCLETCPECDERFCPECMQTCGECGSACCIDCLSDGLCPTCHEKKEDDHEHNEQPVGAPSADAAVQPTAA